MTRHLSTTIIAGVLLLAAAGAAGSTGPADVESTATPGDRCVVVDLVATGEPLLAREATNDTFVALEYTHSVEKTRVLDGYRVRGDRLEMTRMEFESYGAGLPARVAVNRTPNGSFVFDPAGSFEELYVQPGRVAGHVLHVGDRRWDLVALANASTVRLHVAPDCPQTAAIGRIGAEPTGGGGAESTGGEDG